MIYWNFIIFRGKKQDGFRSIEADCVCLSGQTCAEVTEMTKKKTTVISVKLYLANRTCLQSLLHGKTSGF